METVEPEVRRTARTTGLDDPRKGHRQKASLFVLGALYRWRRFVIGLPVLAGLVAVVIVLLKPNEYRAAARVLTPSESNSLLSAMLGGNTARTAARFLGSGVGVGDYTRLLAILNSRRIAEAVVDSFNLVQVYDLRDAKHPREETLDELDARTDFEVDNEYEYLRIAVLDRSPQRAAAIANLFVRLLNRTNTALATQNASTYRRFIEVRYRAAETATDSLLDRFKEFQQRYGVYDLPAQTQAYFEQMGQLRQEQARLQVQLEGLRVQFGPESPEVQATERALSEATRQFNRAIQGSEQAFPVPRAGVPSVAREYAQLERERMLQMSAMEVLAPMYAAAQMEENRTTDAVQVLDLATPPAKKAAPARSLIVILVGLSTFLLTVLFALGWELWRRVAPTLTAQLRTALTTERT